MEPEQPDRRSGPDPWFDVPFDRLTVLSNVEGLTTLSMVEGESRRFQTVMNLDAGGKYRLLKGSGLFST